MITRVLFLINYRLLKLTTSNASISILFSKPDPQIRLSGRVINKQYLTRRYPLIFVRCPNTPTTIFIPTKIRRYILKLKRDTVSVKKKNYSYRTWTVVNDACAKKTV